VYRFSGTTQSIAADIAKVERISSQGGGSAFEFAKTEQDMHNLWSARKEAVWAMCAQRPEGTQIWSTDVAVPLSRMPEIIGTSTFAIRAQGE
jgi:D-lactate dehydrogenase (cytochrome)